MINKTVTCYKCPFRRVGCHKNCTSYKQYKEKLDVIKTNRKNYLNLCSIDMTKRRK